MLVNLSKDEMSLILHYLEKASVSMSDTEADAKFLSIFEKFEGILESCECQAQTDSDSDYAKSVDHLVNSMEQSK